MTDQHPFDHAVKSFCGSTATNSTNSSDGRRAVPFPIVRPDSPVNPRLASIRRNSIATMDTRLVPFHRTHLEWTPEYGMTERSPAYNDLAEIASPAKKMSRRNSMTKVESEVKLRYSLATMKDYSDQNEKLQRLRERFSQSRGSVLSSAGFTSQRSSVIGSVVETATKSDEEFSAGLTSGTLGPESTSLPLTLIHQTIQRKRKINLEREALIESLVNFSCHTPRAVLEDLIAHELHLWEGTRNYENLLAEEKRKEIESSIQFSDGSLSSLSSDEGIDKGGDSDDNIKSTGSYDLVGAYSRLAMAPTNSLPSSKKRESALLFVDINGFTKLSTVLDVESLSKVINSYFEMIVSEVILHGGDILKFAGDAFFAEWRTNDDGTEFPDRAECAAVALKKLNASIHSMSSSQDLSWGSTSSLPTVATCVWQAATCATTIVRKFSDFHVAVPRDSTFDNGEAMLNVHCGIGAGHMIGLHVGDYREDDDEAQEDEIAELRREYIFLGDAINQVS